MPKLQEVKTDDIQDIKASLKMLITKAEKQALLDMGYKRDQISNMKPAEAYAILNGEVKRSVSQLAEEVRKLQRAGTEYKAPEQHKVEVVHPEAMKPGTREQEEATATPRRSSNVVGPRLNIGHREHRGNYVVEYQGIDPKTGEELWEQVGYRPGVTPPKDLPKKAPKRDAEKIRHQDETDDVGRPVHSNTNLGVDLRKVAESVTNLKESIEHTAENVTKPTEHHVETPTQPAADAKQSRFERMFNTLVGRKDANRAKLEADAVAEKAPTEERKKGEEATKTRNNQTKILSQILGVLDQLLHSARLQERFLEAQLKKSDADRIRTEEHGPDASPSRGATQTTQARPAKEKEGGMLSGLLGGLMGGGILKLLKSFVMAPERLGMMIVDFLFSSVSAVFKGLMKLLPGFLTSGIAKFLSKVFIIADLIKGVFDGVLDGIEEYKKTGSIKESVISFATGLVKSLTFGLIDKKTLTQGYNKAEEFITKYLIEPFEDLWDSLSHKFSKVWTKLGDSFDDTVTSAKRMFEDVGDWLGNTMKKIGNGFKSAIASLMESLASIELPKVHIPGPNGGWDIGGFKPFASLGEGAKKLRSDVADSEKGMFIDDAQKKLDRLKEDTATLKSRVDRDDKSDADYVQSQKDKTEARNQADIIRHQQQEQRVSDAATSDAEKTETKLRGAIGDNAVDKLEKSADGVLDNSAISGNVSPQTAKVAQQSQAQSDLQAKMRALDAAQTAPAPAPVIVTPPAPATVPLITNSTSADRGSLDLNRFG